jgi:hypothetical protein
MSDTDEAVDEINRVLEGMGDLDIDSIVNQGLKHLDMDYAMTVAMDMAPTDDTATGET